MANDDFLSECSTVYGGILLPPYSYVVIDIVFYLISENLSKYVLLKFFLYLKDWIKEKFLRHGDKEASEESKSSLSEFFTAQTYLYIKVLQAVCIYIYFIAVESTDTLWSNYQNVYGKVLNSVILNILVGMSTDAAAAAAEKNFLKIQAPFKTLDVLRNNYSIQVYLFFSCFFFCEPVQDNYYSLIRKLEAQSIEEGQRGHIATIASPLQTDSSNVVIGVALTTHTSNVTSTLPSVNADSHVKISDVNVEDLWLEVVYICDYVASQFWFPRIIRCLFIFGGVFTLRWGARILCCCSKTLTTMVLTVARFFYVLFEHQVSLKQMNLMYILSVLIFPSFVTHMLPMVIAYFPIFLFLGAVVYLSNTKIEAAWFLDKMTIKSPEIRSIITHSTIKFLWRLLFYICCNTTFNYAYLLYDGVFYTRAIPVDMLMRHSDCFYTHLFDDNVSRLLIVFAWL